MAKRISTSDKAAEMAERFDVEVAHGSGGADTFIDALAALLLDLAAKQAGRAAGKSKG